MGFLARRFLHALLLLAGVSALSFALYSFAPGDFLAEARLNPQVSPSALTALERRYHTREPLLSRYAGWLSGVVSGDLGYSFQYAMPVAPLLRERAANTLLLTSTSLAVSWLAALAAGLLLSGFRSGALLEAGAAVLVGVPEILLALAALMLAVRSGVLPAGGMHAPSPGQGEAVDLVRHMILPVAVLAAGYFPLLVLHVRASLETAMASGYIRNLRAMGVPRMRLAWNALRGGANPLISLFGYSLGTLAGASLLVEVVFGWPGLGPLLVEAIMARDLFVVVGAVLLSAIFLAAGNLVADGMLYAFDPETRARG